MKVKVSLQEYNQWRASVESQRAADALLASTSLSPAQAAEQQESRSEQSVLEPQASYRRDGAQSRDQVVVTDENGAISPLYEGSLPGSKRGSMEDLYNMLEEYNHNNDLTTYDVLLGNGEDNSAFADPERARNKTDAESMPPPPAPPPPPQQSSSNGTPPSSSSLQERKQKKKRGKKNIDGTLLLLVKAATQLSPEFVLPLLANKLPQGALSEPTSQQPSSMVPLVSSGENYLPPVPPSSTVIPHINLLNDTPATSTIDAQNVKPSGSTNTVESEVGDADADIINMVSEMFQQSPSSPSLSIMVPPSQIIPQNIPRRRVRNGVNVNEMAKSSKSSILVNNNQAKPGRLLESPLDEYPLFPKDFLNLTTNGNNDNVIDVNMPASPLQVLNASNSSMHEKTPTNVDDGLVPRGNSLVSPATFIVKSLDSMHKEFKGNTWTSTVAERGKRLPSFYKLKKKRLPRSVFIETDRPAIGAKRYRVEGEEGKLWDQLQDSYYYPMSPYPFVEAEQLPDLVSRPQSAVTVPVSTSSSLTGAQNGRSLQVNLNLPRPSQSQSAGPVLYGGTGDSQQQRLGLLPPEPATSHSTGDKTFEWRSMLKSSSMVLALPAQHHLTTVEHTTTESYVERHVNVNPIGNIHSQVDISRQTPQMLVPVALNRKMSSLVVSTSLIPSKSALASQTSTSQALGEQAPFSQSSISSRSYVTPIWQLPPSFASNSHKSQSVTLDHQISTAPQSSQITNSATVRRPMTLLTTSSDQTTKITTPSRSRRQINSPVASNSQMNIPIAANSRIPSSPAPYTQMPPSPNPHSQMPPAPSPYRQMPPSPNPYSQMHPSLAPYSQMPSSPNPYGQMPPSPSQYSQMSPSPNPYNQKPSTAANQMAFPNGVPTSGAKQMLAAYQNPQMATTYNSPTHHSTVPFSKTPPATIAYSQNYPATSLNRQMVPHSASSSQMLLSNTPDSQMFSSGSMNRPLPTISPSSPVTPSDGSIFKMPLPFRSSRRNNQLEGAAPSVVSPASQRLSLPESVQFQQNVKGGPRQQQQQSQRPWPGTLTLEQQLLQPITPIVPRQPLSPYLSKFSLSGQTNPKKGLDSQVSPQEQQYLQNQLQSVQYQQHQQQYPSSTTNYESLVSASKRQQPYLSPTSGGTTLQLPFDQQNSRLQEQNRQTGSTLLPLAYAQPYPPAPQSAHHIPSQFRGQLPSRGPPHYPTQRSPSMTLGGTNGGDVLVGAERTMAQRQQVPNVAVRIPSQAQVRQQTPYQSMMLQNLLSQGNPTFSKGGATTNTWVPAGGGPGRGTSEGGNSQAIAPGYERTGTPTSNYQSITAQQGYQARHQPYNYLGAESSLRQQQQQQSSSPSFSYLQRQLQSPTISSNRYPPIPNVGNQPEQQRQWPHITGGVQEAGVSSSQFLPYQTHGQGQRLMASLDGSQAGTQSIQSSQSQHHYPTGQFGGGVYYRTTPTVQNQFASKSSGINSIFEGQPRGRNISREQQGRSNFVQEAPATASTHEPFKNIFPIGSNAVSSNISPGAGSGEGNSNIYSIHNREQFTIQTTPPTTTTSTPQPSTTTPAFPEVIAGGERVLFRPKSSGSQSEADGFGGSGHGRGAQDTRGIGDGRGRGEFSLPIIDDLPGKSQLQKQQHVPQQQLHELSSRQPSQYQQPETPSNSRGQQQGADGGGETGGGVGNLLKVAGGHDSFGFGKGQSEHLRNTGGGGINTNVGYGNSTAWGSAGNRNNNGGEGGGESNTAAQIPQNQAQNIPHQSQDHESQGASTSGGKGEDQPHFRKRLPHHGGDMPFYSQSELDAHHQRVSHNAQTSKDTEFENDSTILSWYLQRAKQELRHRHETSSHKKHETEASGSHQRIGQGSASEPGTVRSSALQQIDSSPAQFPITHSYSTDSTGNSQTAVKDNPAEASISTSATYGRRLSSVSNPSKVVQASSNTQEIHGSAPSSGVQPNANQDGLSSIPRSPASSSSSSAPLTSSSTFTLSSDWPQIRDNSASNGANSEQQQRSSPPRTQRSIEDSPYSWK